MGGTSSGVNAAALQVTLETKPVGAVAILLCDRAERYYSTALFEDSALEKEVAAKV